MIDYDKERAHHQGGVNRVFNLFPIFPYHSFLCGILNKDTIVPEKISSIVSICMNKQNSK